MATYQYEPPSDRALAWVLRCSGSEEVLATERLLGGITSAMDRITVRGRAGEVRSVVLRRWIWFWPHIDEKIERETAALTALQDSAVAAPQLIAADADGDDAGVRSVLMSELPGSVDLAPAERSEWLDRLADALAAIHRLPTTLPMPSEGWFYPDLDYGWINDSGLRREALAVAGGELDRTAPVVVHGDYQPFNVLWIDGQVSGIVDWPMAGVGPSGVDVGHCRVNLAALLSAEAAQAFLDRYQATAGSAVDPVSELRGLLNWSPEWMDFIPLQVAGRAPLDVVGMRDRVVDTIRGSLARIG